MDENMKFDNIRSLEAEQGVLSSMMINNECCYEVLNALNTDDFYYEKNQVIYKAIKNLVKESKKFDLFILAENLKDNNIIQKAGGITYLTQVYSSFLSLEMLDMYIDRIVEYSQRRKLLNLASYINTNIGKGIEELKQEATHLLTNIIAQKDEIETSEIQEEDYLNELERRMSKEDEFIKTGFYAIDNKINGFNPGDLVTIFAFSGVGKTTLALQIALNNIRSNKKVLFFSLEMPTCQIRDRLISNLTKISFRKIRYGELNDKELERVIKANSYLSANNRLLISEEDELLKITNKIQYQVIQNNIDIIFIDYVNLINITGNNKEEYYRITECTRLLKKLAKKIKKPIVILAQGKQEQASKMNNSNMEVWEKVSVNDIAGGASIFRDSDVVLGMYRNIEIDNRAVYEKLKEEGQIDLSSDNPDNNPDRINVLIKKSRASGKGIVSLGWKPETYNISNLVR